MSTTYWYVVGRPQRQRAYGSHPRLSGGMRRKKPNSSSARNRFFPKRRLLAIVPILLFLSFAALTQSRPTSNDDLIARVTPQVSTAPTVIVSPSTVSPLSPGKTFTVQVKVLNMSQFNGWDIQVYASPSVIKATSLSITGNDFAVNQSSGTAFEIVHCVNGVGSGCTSTDGPGIVHSAYGNTGVASGYGLLFTITYSVMTINPFTQITPVNALISSPSSGQGVPTASVGGAYGDPNGGGVGGGLREYEV